MTIAISETKKLIERVERAYTLYILQAEALRLSRFGG